MHLNWKSMPYPQGNPQRAALQWLLRILRPRLQAAHRPQQHGQPEHRGVRWQDQEQVSWVGFHYIPLNNSGLYGDITYFIFLYFRLLENLRMLPHAPGVQMADIPEDSVNLDKEVKSHFLSLFPYQDIRTLLQISFDRTRRWTPPTLTREATWNWWTRAGKLTTSLKRGNR